jgi:hypothetical protein
VRSSAIDLRKVILAFPEATGFSHSQDQNAKWMTVRVMSAQCPNSDMLNARGDFSEAPNAEVTRRQPIYTTS